MASEWQPIGAALSMGLGAVGSGLGIGMLANGALQSLGRNPEARGPVQQSMICLLYTSDAADE